MKVKNDLLHIFLQANQSSALWLNAMHSGKKWWIRARGSPNKSELWEISLFATPLGPLLENGVHIVLLKWLQF